MKDDLNLQTDNNNKALGMKWFHFFYQVRCVFGILLSIPFTLTYFALAKEAPLMYILAFLNIPVVIANIIIVFNYFKNKIIGYFPMIVYKSTMFVLVIDAISSLLTVNIFYAIFIGLNFYYFSKRKFVFFGNNNENKSEEEVNQGEDNENE